MTISNASEIPNKDWLANACQTIYNCLKENLEASKDVNVSIAGETKFCGFTSIEEI